MSNRSRTRLSSRSRLALADRNKSNVALCLANDACNKAPGVSWVDEGASFFSSFATAVRLYITDCSAYRPTCKGVRANSQWSGSNVRCLEVGVDEPGVWSAKISDAANGESRVLPVVRGVSFGRTGFHVFAKRGSSSDCLRIRSWFENKTGGAPTAVPISTSFRSLAAAAAARSATATNRVSARCVTTTCKRFASVSHNKAPASASSTFPTQKRTTSSPIAEAPSASCRATCKFRESSSSRILESDNAVVLTRNSSRNPCDSSRNPSSSSSKITIALAWSMSSALNAGTKCGD